MANQDRSKKGAALTRREFAVLSATAAVSPLAAATDAPRVLIVVAHPDDEYAFAATVFRLTRDLGGVVDQVVISNGEGGYRYSALAEQVYGIPFTQQPVGRQRLPEIRRRETLAAGKILGIRSHHFLGQRDEGYTEDPVDAGRLWDQPKIRQFLSNLIRQERYNFIFTMLPAADTHGHHQLATRLAIEAVQLAPQAGRPIVLGAEPASSHDAPRNYAGRSAYEFSRTRPFGFKNALNYSIVVNWVIAEHKSQGLFQTDVGKHDVERFWILAGDEGRSAQATRSLLEKLSGEAAQSVAAR